MDRLLNNRTWSAFAVGAVMIALAPALMISQTGSASEPWDNPWVEEWPSLLDRPIATDREMAALQQRIDASLQRLLKDGTATPPSKQL